jgi:bacterioferritin-associated ferredoxin
MIVCLCRRVSDLAIRTAIDEGARTVAEVSAACRAGTGCGSCHETIEDMIHERTSCADCPRKRHAILSPYVTGAQDRAAGDTA